MTFGFLGCLSPQKRGKRPSHKDPQLKSQTCSWIAHATFKSYISVRAHCSASTELISQEVKGDSKFLTMKTSRYLRRWHIVYLGSDPNTQRSVGTFAVSSAPADLDLCRDCKGHQRTSLQGGGNEKLTSLFTLSKLNIPEMVYSMAHFWKMEATTVSQ